MVIPKKHLAQYIRYLHFYCDDNSVIYKDWQLSKICNIDIYNGKGEGYGF